MDLLRVDTIDAASGKLEDHCGSIMPRTETVNLYGSIDRVLAQNIISNENIPPYRRSIMDGYAVRSRDLGAAGDMVPSFLKISGEVLLGTDSSDLVLEPGHCIYVPTGGFVPDGADAVVMVEYCEPFGSGMLAVSKSASAGENIVQVGEDVAKGDLLLPKGRRLRPQDIGVLAAAGVTEVPVFVPWRVTVISTGDELVSPEEMPGPGQIRDINSYTIAARSAAEGLNVVKTVSLRDDETVIAAVLEEAKAESDVIVMSGGSSQGKKDMTAELIEKAADCGVLTHGIAAKPGKPTITGFDKNSGTLFIGLPGHPAAAIIVFEQLLIRLWRSMTAQSPEITIKAVVKTNIPSAPGRRTFQLVTLKDGDVPEAVPVFARSGMISPVSLADGFFEMEENREGVKDGDIVEVHLWK
ncbi:MAG: molybdopterin molybdotransferase MoeA [Mogibacterium sp.]|nr:molybdopterin molybdotransferase MoeA [Mogibacterium sp.]MBQ6501102.1 molybdopterin molybdotransferase MoeA [Mogibacterium sp.]